MQSYKPRFYRNVIGYFDLEKCLERRNIRSTIHIQLTHKIPDGIFTAHVIYGGLGADRGGSRKD